MLEGADQTLWESVWITDNANCPLHLATTFEGLLASSYNLSRCPALPVTSLWPCPLLLDRPSPAHLPIHCAQTSPPQDSCPSPFARS